MDYVLFLSYMFEDSTPKKCFYLSRRVQLISWKKEIPIGIHRNLLIYQERPAVNFKRGTVNRIACRSVHSHVTHYSHCRQGKCSAVESIIIRGNKREVALFDFENRDLTRENNLPKWKRPVIGHSRRKLLSLDCLPQQLYTYVGTAWL